MYTTLKLLKSDLKNLRNAGSKFTNILEVGVRETSSSYTSTPVSLIYLYTVCTSQYTIHMYPYIYIYTCFRGVYFGNTLSSQINLYYSFHDNCFCEIFYRQSR